MPNIFCHVELATDKPEDAKKFYAKMFDWKFGDMPMPGGAIYHGFETGSQECCGGIYKKPTKKDKTAWTAYVLVGNVARALLKVETLGGKIIVPRTEIPGLGWYAIIADPTGGTMGLFEPKKAPKPKAEKPAPKKEEVKKPEPKPAKKAPKKK